MGYFVNKFLSWNYYCYDMDRITYALVSEEKKEIYIFRFLMRNLEDLI